MRILGIESTCDETGSAVVEDGVKVISNVVSSSLRFHKKYGGVVPEVAAREQVKVIIPTIDKSLEGIQIESIDSIAVSYGPGLIGPLLIGVECAKALSFAWNKPLVGVNHLVGHIYSCWLDSKDVPKFPLIALIVSGGHTDLVYMKGHKDYKWLGGTRDDAAGEVFDKIARKLGLSYPGGPEIEKSAYKWDGELKRIFTRPMISDKSFDFSFSGLKTQVINFINKTGTSNVNVSMIAYEFQEAIADTLVEKTLRAAIQFAAKSIVVGGGVAANQIIKQKMEYSGTNAFKIFFPNRVHAIDNGAMIGAAAFFNYKKILPLTLSADPSLHFA